MGAIKYKKGGDLMPRKARKDMKTEYLHVMSQGINKEFIFRTDELKKKYKNLLKDLFLNHLYRLRKETIFQMKYLAYRKKENILCRIRNMFYLL